ncbi:MAG: efflux RND transporter periplasmic adaptor subunit [Methylotenera sp.]|uniref:efflux RND transporter periplasmic adaptor subunit n=1 Tax=Methylotenera sp. TaxID=2051956 RepID=UPI00248A3EE9|nr:efflux RND transporter periplasmic adaptor subunit [Methylotenera sp.]MDI1309624.1 efflux RND transporter periplasmic adaptor subunit [Methylotenera sp.]
MSSLLKGASFTLLLAVAACSKSPAHDVRTDPQPVIIAKVMAGDAGKNVFTGIVTARVQSDLGFRIGGKVTERFVDIGQAVKKGQPLLKLDPTDLNLSTTGLKASVAAAKAIQVQADADLSRLEGLVEQGAISAQRYDLAKAAAATARAKLTEAEAAESMTSNAERYALLIADTDGVVVTTMAEPGQVVQAGQVVIKLAKNGPREAAINLPETIRPSIGSIGQAILYGDNGKSSPAKLRELSDSADPATRTFSAKYILQGSAADAPLGSTISISFSHKANTSVVVPLGALYDPGQGQGPGVWVFNRPTSNVHFNKVKVASLTDDQAIITNGVHPGDEVIALGAHLLHENEVVRVLEDTLGAL